MKPQSHAKLGAVTPEHAIQDTTSRATPSIDVAPYAVLLRFPALSLPRLTPHPCAPNAPPPSTHLAHRRPQLRTRHDPGRRVIIHALVLRRRLFQLLAQPVNGRRHQAPHSSSQQGAY